MDLRNFFSLQNVQPSELNELVTAIDKAIGRLGYDTGTPGVAYGLTVTPTDPVSMAVNVQPGVALWADPLVAASSTEHRIKVARLSAATSISLAADYLGASTAVTAGQERWVSIVVRQKYVGSDPRTDGSGNVIDFIQTEDAELIVVSGTAATAGSARRPTVAAQALGTRIADKLITYNMSLVESVDVTWREDACTLLRGGDDTNAVGYSPFWESQRNTTKSGVVRAYLCTGDTGYGPAGLVLTYNARWDPDLRLWIGIDDHAAWAIRFGAQGILMTTRTEGLETGWAEQADGSWNDAVDSGNTDSLQMTAAGLKIFSQRKSALIKSDGVTTASGGYGGEYGGAHADNSSVTMPVAFSGVAGPAVMGSPQPILFSVTFPRPFAVAPEHLMIGADIAADSGFTVDIGTVGDLNVATYTHRLTKEGVFFLIYPSVASTWTRFSRVITVSQ
jgi:hypothetical protein